MTDAIEQREPKSAYYRVRATNEILPALKTPAGYEDDHPGDYEPCDAPKVAAKLKPAPTKPE